MTLVKFQKPQTLPDFIDRFFNSDPFFGNDLLRNAATSFVPAVNIRENSEGFTLELAVPGRKKEDFKIELHEQTLTISSEKKEQHEETDAHGKFTRREFGYSSFSRAFHLPHSIDAQRIEAVYEDGVLRITLAKKEEAKDKGPRQISIG